jgi:NTP pyrophosphatase (non-canonical NTP hydrolase)
MEQTMILHGGLQLWYDGIMQLTNLQKQVKELGEKTTPKYKLYTQTEKEILTKTIKLNEEVGELCNDILSILKLQRKSKLEKFDKRNIYEEFADVIITTIQLANSAGVDIERAISDKMKKIEKRYNRDH